jgi:hypothetical protein
MFCEVRHNASASSPSAKARTSYPPLDSTRPVAFAHQRFVFDENDATSDPGPPGYELGRARPVLLFGRHSTRERDPECGSPRWFTFHVNRPQGTLYLLFDGREAEARSRGFRRKEGFENPFLVCLSHAYTGIAHQQLDSGVSDGHFGSKAAPVRHGVARIDSEIQDDLFQADPWNMDPSLAGRFDLDVIPEPKSRGNNFFSDLRASLMSKVSRSPTMDRPKAQQLARDQDGPDPKPRPDRRVPARLQGG